MVAKPATNAKSNTRLSASDPDKAALREEIGRTGRSLLRTSGASRHIARPNSFGTNGYKNHVWAAVVGNPGMSWGAGI